MKVALCQINTVPGDVPGNVDRIRRAAHAAAERGAELAVLPELAIVGYCPRDLLFRRRFIEAADRALADLARSSGAMGIVVGTVGTNPSRVGRPFTNEAVLVANGGVVARVRKTLLPAYDVFDEARYFEPGGPTGPVAFRGRRIGLIVCEDLWRDPVEGGARGYAQDPVAELARKGCELLINVSASPFSSEKPALREGLVSRTAAQTGLPLFLCNLVGGNDEVLFDGRSVAVDGRGRLLARAPAFEEATIVVDDAAPAREAPPLPDADDPAELHAALVMGLADYARKSGFTRAHLGLSGGIDSALVAVLAVDALGAEAVRGFALPGPFSSPGSLRDATELARALGIRIDTMGIGRTYDDAVATVAEGLGPAPFGVTEENVQSRIRGLLLMAVANRTGSLLLSTGNKSELAVGYCTLYGDLCGGLAVISDVYKTDVYRLARWIKRTRGLIPDSSLDRPPSAELRPNQTDQDSLPPYDVLDAILREHLENELGARDLVLLGHDEATVRRVLGMVARNEFKRHQAPCGLRVSRKAFGQGRRVPIAASGLEWLAAAGPEPESG
jgi:NAD+ synthetase